MTDITQLATGLQDTRNEQYDDVIIKNPSSLANDQSGADVFGRGCKHLHLGEYQQAINDFNSAITSLKLSHKYELPALYKRGFANFKINQFDSALDDYKHYIIICESHEERKRLIHKGYFQMGVVYAASNQYDSAVRYFTQAIDNSLDTEEDKQKLYYLHRGRAYACCAKFDEAQSDLQRVLKESCDLFVKGCAHNELGQHQEAFKQYDNLLQFNGNQSKLVGKLNAHVQFRRGLSYASLDLHDDALNDFQSASDNSEQQGSSKISDRIFFRKGLSHMALNNTHKALVDLNESAKLNKSQADVFYARGMLHYTIGRHDAAAYDQRQAMELERKSPSSAPIYNTTHHIHKYNYGGHPLYTYYQNKIHELEELLKNNKGSLGEADIHRMIAEYLQKNAFFSNDPSKSHKEARGHIKKACQLSGESKDADSVSLAINGFSSALLLIEKCENRTVSESVAEEYIKYAADSILQMSELFDKCITTGRWKNLEAVLGKERDKSSSKMRSDFDIIRNNYVNIQLEKLDIIQKTKDTFADSVAQQEFYGFFVIRLCNLFDGIRMASTGIFSHSLEGTLSKVSLAFKIVGKVLDNVPIGSEYVKKVCGLCETGFKKLDEQRIENTLTHMAGLGDQTMFNKTADAIAKELTIMYKDQIEKFPTTTEEANAAAAKTGQQEDTSCTKCKNCFKKCCRCMEQAKQYVGNETEYSIIQTIVEYGVSLSLSCLVKITVKDIPKLDYVQNRFVNGICRPSSLKLSRFKPFADKIKPKVTENKDEYWITYDFYRQPAILFENGVIRERVASDHIKYGCRKPTADEKRSLQEETELLDSYGFKILVENEN